MSSKILPKITTSTLGFNSKMLNSMVAENPDREIPIYTVVGIVSSPPEIKTAQYGDYARFKGQFLAEIAETGETAQSKMLILPELAGGLLLDECDNIGQDGVTGKEFGIQITVKYNPSSENREGNKYMFGCVPLIQSSEPTMLQNLLSTAKTQSLE